MRRIAIIPARGGSKRLPRKNILDLLGKPMIAYPITSALETGLFESVIVSTEDEEIAQISRDYGAEIMDRSSDLAGDKAQVINVCHDVLTRLQESDKKPDVICCIYATAVFLQKEDFIKSEHMLHENNTDVVMGVSEYPLHPYKAMESKDGFLKPIFPDFVKKQSQNYPHAVASNGTLYWARTDYFLENPDFYAERLAGCVIPNDRAPDIDTQADYEHVKLMAEIGLKTKEKFYE